MWGCCWQTAERYVRRAREAALRALGRTKEDHIIEAIAFNDAVERFRASVREVFLPTLQRAHRI
jgi:hypothetical protein